MRRAGSPRVIDPLGQTHYAYDEAGDLVEQTDANGHITHYEYDGLGERTATILPLGQRSDHLRCGRQRRQHDRFQGPTTTYQYDTKNRLIAEQFPDGTSDTSPTRRPASARRPPTTGGTTLHL